MPRSDDKPRHSDEPRYGSCHVLLVDGLYDGQRVSGFIARGRLTLAEGEYRHVLGGDAICLYWVPNPILAEVRPAARAFPSITR